jgi:hypothetical protein
LDQTRWRWPLPSRPRRIQRPRGEKSSYTDKQKRQAQHIEQSEKKEGRSKEDAERIAWATVNKQDGGGNKSGSGRKSDSDKSHTRH